MFVGISSPTQITSTPFFSNIKIKLNLNNSHQSIQNLAKSPSSSCTGGGSNNNICLCGRRPFLATISTALIPLHQSNASDSFSDDPIVWVHPPRPDWYEEFYAVAMDASMKSYEDEIAGYKSELFANLTTGKAAKILEIGIGTGPNLKYYSNLASGASVVGVDPNRKMEKYAQAAAQASGLPPTKFQFIHAFMQVAEALPVSDASMDAVVGTLVLCSVKDVNKTLQEVKRVLKPGGIYIFVEHVAAEDGTFLKVIQRALDPLQQVVADGCHLTRETGDSISAAGFSSTDIKKVFLSSASLINPHAYGIAYK
ncbi:methyltransferase-like protein 7A isoform X3 [Helianthus annuus]|uniref:methyltransferase-like protein 7A isoform X3 n=1 Tax=Helianthus annuus TaxID=4232 RepID=UPI001652CDE4|nr:methyltransferase-like protein 7A isoform X3 [Helianthus annuus]